LASLEKLSSSHKPRRAAQCTARNINCENIGMITASNLSAFVPQDKQKSYGCHSSSAAATRPFPVLLWELCVLSDF